MATAAVIQFPKTPGLKTDAEAITSATLFAKRTQTDAATARQGFKDLGQACLALRNAHSANIAYGAACREHGLDIFDRQERSDAIWLYQNWDAVVGPSYNGPGHASRIRRGHSAKLKGEVADDFSESAPTTTVMATGPGTTRAPTAQAPSQPTPTTAQTPPATTTPATTPSAPWEGPNTISQAGDLPAPPTTPQPPHVEPTIVAPPWEAASTALNISFTIGGIDLHYGTLTEEQIASKLLVAVRNHGTTKDRLELLHRLLGSVIAKL